MVVIESPESAIARAQAVAQSGIVELIEKREVSVLMQLVGAYRSNKLTDRDAAIGIATIANLRSMREDMTRAVLRGTDAGQSLTEPSNA